MKKFYYISHKSKLENVFILHVRDCWVLPIERKYIGNYKTLQEAVDAAESHYLNVSICEYCINNPDPA